RGVFFTFGPIDHFLSRAGPLAPAPRPSRDQLEAGKRDLYAGMASTCRGTPRSAHGPPKFVPSPGKAESGSLAPAEGSRVEGRRSPAAAAHSSARADLSGASARRVARYSAALPALDRPGASPAPVPLGDCKARRVARRRSTPPHRCPPHRQAPSKQSGGTPLDPVRRR